MKNLRIIGRTRKGRGPTFNFAFAYHCPIKTLKNETDRQERTVLMVKQILLIIITENVSKQCGEYVC